MKRIFLRRLSFVLVLILFVQCLPVSLIGEQFLQMRLQAQAEEARTEIADTALEGLSASFEAYCLQAEVMKQQGNTSQEGEWIYVRLPETDYAVICGHASQGEARIDIPAALGGADVIGLLDNVFTGHAALREVTFSTNLYHAGSQALPRGVTVRGYHGSYAQKWAAENGHAFTNLSELDFVTGVVDCSDMDPAHFTRYSEKRITMRMLEASRLQPGSVFFLPDPDNLFAIAYYQVAKISETGNGNRVEISCETPGSQDVVNSFTFDNAPLMPDWSTMSIEPGIGATVEEVQRLSGSESSTVTFPYLSHSFEKWGKTISFGVTPSYTYKLSGEYRNFKLQEAEITETSSYRYFFRVSESGSLFSEDSDYDRPVSEAIKNMIASARKFKGNLHETVDSSKKLSHVTLFSWWGILSLSFDISFNIKVSGTLEVNYTTSSTTKYTYHDGTLSSTSSSDKKSITGSMKGEVKAGVFISLNLYVLCADIFDFGVFVGIKASASMQCEVVLAEHKETVDAVTGGHSISDVGGDLNVTWLNNLDCISIQIDFVIDVEAKLLKKTIWSKNILDLEIARWHCHVSPYYYTDNPLATLLKDRPSLFFHNENDCPYTNSVYLLVPELDQRDTRSAAFKSILLESAYQTIDLPTLDLPSYGKRVSSWYRDRALTSRYFIGNSGASYAAHAGDMLYGKTTDVGTLRIIHPDGELHTSKSTHSHIYVAFGEKDSVSTGAAWRCLADGETLNSKDLNLAEEDHIIGYRKMTAPSALNPMLPQIGELIPNTSAGVTFTGNGTENQAYIAVCDNEYTGTFLSPAGSVAKTLGRGFMQTVEAADAPSIPVSSSVWEIEWFDEDGNQVSFPVTVMKDFTIRAHKHYIGSDHSATVIGTYPSTSFDSPVSDSMFYSYTVSDDHATITGLSPLAAGITSLAIPSSVDGCTVTAISSDAFRGNTSIQYVRLPSTIQSVGLHAFSGCTSLQVINMSACSELDSLPSYMAQGDTDLRFVTLAYNISSIGRYAFDGCTALAGKADINASVDDYAFYLCAGLTDLEFHYSTERIGNFAFAGCENIASVSIVDSLMTIGTYAFADCSCLGSIVVPDSVTAIGADAFTRCNSLTSMTLPFIGLGEGASSNRVFRNLFYDSSYNYAAPGEGVPENLRTVTITSALSIPDYAFYGCSGIATITINGAPTSVGYYAFDGCTSLTSISIPDTVTQLGNYAFSGCSALPSIRIPDHVTSIGDYAFYNCSSLPSVSIPRSVTSIGRNAFTGCTGFTEIVVPKSVQSIGLLAFQGCNSLTSMTLPFIGLCEGTTSNRAFRNLFYSSSSDSSSPGAGVPSDLKTVTITSALSIPDYAFYGCGGIETIIISGTPVSVGYSAFRDCISLSSLTFPETVTQLGGYAFYGCSALPSIRIPRHTTSIGDYAFYNCSSLASVSIPGSVISIGNNAFTGCTGLTEIVVPESVQSIGLLAFQGCNSLTSMTLPFIGLCEGTTSDRAFRHLFYSSSGDSSAPGTGVPSSLKAVIITNAASIPNYAFYGCSSIETIIINGTPSSVGSSAFCGCTSLTAISIPDTVTQVDSYAFYGCSVLPSIHIPDFVTSIGDYAFYHCSSLASVSIPGSVTSIGRNAFTGCTGLTEIVVPESVQSIGLLAFQNCNSLTSMILPFIGLCEGTTSNRAFRNLFYTSSSDSSAPGMGVPLGLKTVIITNAASIPNYAFYGCNSIETIIINGTPASVGSSAFHGCTSLTAISIPDTVTQVDSYAFQDCSILPSIHVPGFVTSIGDYAFYNCSSLASVSIPGGVTSIGRNAFTGCTGLTEIVVPESVQSIGLLAFQNCNSLTSMTLPFIGLCEGTTSNRAFRNLFYSSSGDSSAPGMGVPSSLKAVIITNAASIPNYAFYGCSSIETIIINGTPSSVGSSAFCGCTSLTTISIPDTITQLGSYAFSGCSAFTTLTLPSGLTDIDSYALNGCSGLPLATDPTPVGGGIASHAYNALIAQRAEEHNYLYTWKTEGIPSFTLRLIQGTSVLYTAEMDAGTDLSNLFAQYRPGDTVDPAASDTVTFSAWSLLANGSAPWRSFVMPAFDLTLYACMVPVRTAEYVCVADGRTVYSTTMTAGVGQPVPKPAVPSLTGYTFDGWYMDPACHAALTDNEPMPESGITLYGKVRALPATMAFKLKASGMELARYMSGANPESRVDIPAYYSGIPVTSIASGAFRDASGVRILQLPATLETIAEDALDGLTGLYTFQMREENAHFLVRDGVLFSGNGQTLIRYPSARSGINYTVPDGTTAIADRAFLDAALLNTLNLPESVRSLGRNALSGCNSLTSFTAMGLTSIGEGALPLENFSLSVYGPVKTGILRETLLLSEQDGLPMFKLPYNNYPLNLYLDGTKLASYSIEAGSVIPDAFLYEETDDGNWVYAWFTDSALTSQWAFSATTPTASLTLYASSEPTFAYEQASFDRTQGVLLTAYHGRGGHLVLPEVLDGLPVKGIGAGFLASCHGTVSSIRIGSSVIQIDETALTGPAAYPFGGIVYAEADSWAAAWAAAHGYTVISPQYTLSFETFGGNLLHSRTLASGSAVLLPDPVRTGCTFGGWYLDEALTQVAPLDDGCFIMPASDCTLYACWDGEAAMYAFAWEEVNETITITGLSGDETELTIPETVNGLPVTAVAEESFAGSNITSIVLPASVTAIGAHAFAGSALAYADLGGAETIGDYAFSGCEQLAGLVMTNVSTLGTGVFSGCTALTSFPVPATLTSFAPDAVSGCRQLRAFDVADGHPCYSSADGVLLLNGISLVCWPAGKTTSSCTLPPSVMMIAPEAFADARYLRDIVLPANLVSIGQRAFAGCERLESLVFEDGIQLTTIPFGCFEGCAMLTEVTIPDSVTGINGLAFFGCDSLTDIYIPESVTTIGSMALTGSVKIHGVYGSTAWQYAMDNSLLFEAVSGTEVTALAISLDLGADHVEPGTVLPVSAVVSPENASLNGEIIWTTSDSSLAFIYDGEIHFLAPGSVTIQAAAPNGVYDSLEISIRVDAQAVELNRQEIFLLPDQDAWLRAAFTPANTTDQSLVWTAGDESVVHVTQNGHLIPLKTGTTLVTAMSASGLSASCLVHVADIRLSVSALTLTAGQKVRPELLISGDVGSAVPAWTSGSDAVSVTDDVLTAASGGSADVSCTLGDLVFHIQVTVVDSLATLKLPGSLNTVEESAFEGTVAVGCVILPVSVSRIESLAFAQMPALKQLIVPNTGVSMAGDCLSGSSGAVILYRNGSGSPANSDIPYAFLID